jgi:hypothetical protein
LTSPAGIGPFKAKEYDMTISDKWSLSEDGKTLMIERKFTSSQGDMVQKYAMEKP